MILKSFIRWLGKDDYYFVVSKKSKYNTTGRTELHTLNSDSFVELGTIRCIKYILK